MSQTLFSTELDDLLLNLEEDIERDAFRLQIQVELCVHTDFIKNSVFRFDNETKKDMVKAYLAQCNRLEDGARLIIH